MDTTQINPQSFKLRIVSKYPQGVAGDGRKYAEIPDEELTQMVVSKFPEGVTNDGIKYSDFLKGGATYKRLNYENEATRSNKKAAIQSEVETTKKESEKANSLLGKISNFGKSFVENIAGSEVGLGKTIRKVFGNQRDKYTSSIQTLTDAQVNLSKLIRKQNAEGKDTSKLQGMYAENQKQLQELGVGLGEELNLPTTGQVAGQFGGTALDLLTAGTYGKAVQGMKGFALSKPTISTTKAITTPIMPELGKIAEQKAGGLFTKVGAKNIGKGASIGYGYDVTQGLQGTRGEERTGSKAFIPGLGTAIGTALPLISETQKSFSNRAFKKSGEGIIEKRMAELQKIEDSNASLRKLADKHKSRGIDAKRILASTDLLKGSVDETGTIRTQNAIDELNDFIKPQEDVISKNLQKEGKKLPVSFVEKELKKSINNSNLEGDALSSALNKAEREVAGYKLRADKDGYITLSKIHDAKVNKYANINYLDPNSKQADKVIAKTLKEIVENHTNSVNVKNLNAELSQHFAVLDLLEKLNGKKAEGGRLGKYFAQTVGSIVGSHFGPLGSIAGAELGGRIKGYNMSRTFGGKTGGKLKTTEAMQKAVESGKDSVIEMPGKIQSSNSLGNRNISQSKTINPTNKNGISSKIPPNQNGSKSKGGYTTLGTLAAGAAIGAGTVFGQRGSTETYTRPEPQKTPDGSFMENLKKEVAYRESRGESDPYKARGKKGELGKYQALPASLEAYGDDYLGRNVTADEFINSPELQEKFFEGFVSHMKSVGITDTEILMSLWHKGWSNRDVERVKNIKNEASAYLANKSIKSNFGKP